VAGTSFADGARRLVATATTQYRMRQTTLKLELRRNDYRPGSVDDAVSGAGPEAWQEFTARLSLGRKL
jgi:hypothetical protein